MKKSSKVQLTKVLGGIKVPQCALATLAAYITNGSNALRNCACEIFCHARKFVVRQKKVKTCLNSENIYERTSIRSMKIYCITKIFYYNDIINLYQYGHC